MSEAPAKDLLQSPNHPMPFGILAPLKNPGFRLPPLMRGAVSPATKPAPALGPAQGDLSSV
jgi:hypothetical protein